MASPSETIVLSAAAKTREELSRKILQLQTQAGAKHKTVTICFDPVNKEWVWWYIPAGNSGGGIF